ncbi:hypothetical protein [Pseudonocardia parietis]|uniref:Transposase n=1 Tax=Pseudonocardia parietis TaxID=570936 RepID=A0ABS4VW29_9PSEU|nr:hypothetical protein [Pseudonocardia parietis]MBP2368121.1 hypothetical protein [Pseudonocardia parietis]
MDADAVAEQLYRVPPGEFVAARDDAVTHARDAGDKAAARAIAALRRPTRAAWLTNLLVDAAPDEVEGLLALAGPLADAQRSLDGSALRQVSAQRNKLVGALARRAARLGREAGQQVDSGLEREVRGVLESALADDDLAAQVRSGRLVRFERHSGFGTFGADDGDGRRSGPSQARKMARPKKDPGTDSDSEDERPATGTGAGSGAAADGGPGSGADTDTDADTGSDSDTGTGTGTGELDRKRREVDRRTREQRRAEREEREREAAERRDRERREQALADAQDRLEQARLAANDATRERDDARERADDAAEHRDDAHRRVDDLRAELDRARAEATEADRALKSVEREAGDAARRARRADAEVTRAEQELDAARDT